jgi:hypothetical protein
MLTDLAPECIAEYTGRPLLSLTCSDVGTEETLMETQLSKWFALAEKWGAVMLLDEADVYLEKRSPGDVKRNGLVSGRFGSMPLFLYFIWYLHMSGD